MWIGSAFFRLMVTQFYCFSQVELLSETNSDFVTITKSLVVIFDELSYVALVIPRQLFYFLADDFMKLVARYFSLLESIDEAKVYISSLKILLLLESYFVKVGVRQCLTCTHPRLGIELEHALEQLKAALVHRRVHFT